MKGLVTAKRDRIAERFGTAQASSVATDTEITKSVGIGPAIAAELLARRDQLAPHDT